MGKDVYVAHARVVQDAGIYRRIYLGNYAQPLVVGIMGRLKNYTHHEETREEIPSTMDYLPAMVGA
jgi:hypothetical protein